ncbi:MAG: helix-turn-helix transcriptional regulator [Chitinophagaceae bacterium]
MMDNTKTRSAGEILAELSEGEISGWSERACYRRANRAWIRRSRLIAIHVLNALDAKGMNQKQLAEAIEVTPEYISKLVKGGENLTLEIISKLEAVLQINILEVRDF